MTPPRYVIAKALHGKEHLVIIGAEGAAFFNLYQGTFSSSGTSCPHTQTG